MLYPTRSCTVILPAIDALPDAITSLIDVLMDALLSLSPEPFPTGASPSLTSMPLPPEATYSSKEELYASIQAWAARHHYAFRIGRSAKIHNTVRSRIQYNCDRCGPQPPLNHPEHS